MLHFSGTPQSLYVGWFGMQSGELDIHDSIGNNLPPETYYIEMSDPYGCIDTNFTIDIRSYTVSANANSSDLVCYGNNSGSASVAATGTAPLTYLWNTSPAQTTSAVTGLAAGTYTCAVTDSAGCVVTNTVTLTQPAAISTTVSALPSLCGLNTGSASVAASGGTGALGYLWSNTQTTASVTGLSPATYSVTVTDANNCTVVQAVAVTTPSPLIIYTAASVSLCVGQNVALSAMGQGGTAGYSYSWSDGQTNAVITVQPTTTVSSYTVTVTDSNGCKKDTTITVTAVPFPIAAITGDTSVCRGITANLLASGGISYLWDSGESTAGISVTPLNTATYSVSVSNGNCADTAEIQITVVPNPVAVVSNDTTIIPGVSVMLMASGGISYSWSSAAGLSCSVCSDPVATPSVTTTYYVTVIDANGCATIDSITISILETPCNVSEIFIPNSFSPNEDGQNDVLKLFSSSIPETFYFAIYDRWGEIIFESTDHTLAWDGTHRNKPMDTAVFTYLLKVTCKGDTEENIEKGNISLLR